MDKVVHFEIPADDVGRARSFYQTTFGWETQEMPEFNYTTVRTAPVSAEGMPTEPGAINGGMYPRDPSMPNVQIYIDVADIETSLKKITEQGGKVVREKTPIGEMGFIANFKDTEGNVIGLWQTAK